MNDLACLEFTHGTWNPDRLHGQNVANDKGNTQNASKLSTSGSRANSRAQSEIQWANVGAAKSREPTKTKTSKSIHVSKPHTIQNSFAGTLPTLHSKASSQIERKSNGRTSMLPTHQNPLRYKISTQFIDWTPQRSKIRLRQCCQHLISDQEPKSKEKFDGRMCMRQTHKKKQLQPRMYNQFVY